MKETHFPSWIKGIWLLLSHCNHLSSFWPHPVNIYCQTLQQTATLWTYREGSAGLCWQWRCARYHLEQIVGGFLIDILDNEVGHQGCRRWAIFHLLPFPLQEEDAVHQRSQLVDQWIVRCCFFWCYCSSRPCSSLYFVTRNALMHNRPILHQLTTTRPFSFSLFALTFAWSNARSWSPSP